MDQQSKHYDELKTSQKNATQKHDDLIAENERLGVNLRDQFKATTDALNKIKQLNIDIDIKNKTINEIQCALQESAHASLPNTPLQSPRKKLHIPNDRTIGSDIDDTMVDGYLDVTAGIPLIRTLSAESQISLGISPPALHCFDTVTSETDSISGSGLNSVSGSAHGERIIPLPPNNEIFELKSNLPLWGFYSL